MSPCSREEMKHQDIYDTVIGLVSGAKSSGHVPPYTILIPKGKGVNLYHPFEGTVHGHIEGRAYPTLSVVLRQIEGVEGVQLSNVQGVQIVPFKDPMTTD
jgi:hypothetical protein